MKRLLTLIIMILCLVALTAGSQIKRRPPKPSTPQPSQSEKEMSAAFQEQGHRALDAILRLPGQPSADKDEPGFEQRKLDVEKAIDEAKYKARTAKDKEVLKVLQAAGFLMGAASDRYFRDPDWISLIKAASQCKLELEAEFEPDELSDLGLKAAAEKTCLQKQDEIVNAWTEKRKEHKP